MLRRLFLSLIFVSATLVFAQEPATQPTLTPQQSGTTELLISVSAVNSNVVWASGTGGTFVVTTDGGKHWKAGVVPGAELLQFRDVQGVSDSVAYLMSIGDNPTDFRIYKTADGGATWNEEFVNQTVGAFYDCFAFWAPNRGVAHSDSVNGLFPEIRTFSGQKWHSIEGKHASSAARRSIIFLKRHLHHDSGRSERLGHDRWIDHGPDSGNNRCRQYLECVRHTSL